MGADLKAIAGVDTSRTYTPASGSGTVTDTTNLPYPLGTVISRGTTGTDGERRFKLVLQEDGDSTVGNLAIYTTDDNGYEISVTNGENTADNNQPAGLIITAITDGDAGWVQTYGLSLVDIVTDGNAEAGDDLIPHSTTDGAVIEYIPGTDAPAESLGHALNDDGTTSASVLDVGEVFLNCPKG